MKTQTSVLGEKGHAVFKISLLALGVVLLSGHGNAQDIIPLVDGGSSATIDLDSSAGMDNWSVLGQNQLNQQWFWYSVGGGIAQPINSIGGLTFTQNGQANYLSATYANSQLSINVQYTLSGGGNDSGNADITETISVKNLSTTSGINLKLFEYSNFNLLGEANDTVNIAPDLLNPSGYNFVQQNNGAGTAIAEGITSPDANFAEAGFVTDNPNTLDNISTVSGYNLNNQLTAGAGDVSWAFEWDPTVAAGQDFQIFKDKSLSIQMVPEPTTTALIGLGLGACGLGRRAWKKKI